MTDYKVSPQFLEAAAKVKTLKKEPAEADLSIIYCRYKHATEGPLNPANEARPGFMNMVARRKWDLRKEIKDMTREEAEKEYIEKVDALVASIGVRD